MENFEKFNKWKQLVKSMEKTPLDQQPAIGVNSGSSVKESRTKNDLETLTGEPQGGSSNRSKGVKKAKAHMTGKMVAD